MRANEMQSFDTHKFIKQIQSTGLKENQAEAIVDILKESRNFDLSKLATKDQLQNVEERLSAKIHMMESSLVKWNIGTIIAMTGIIIAVLKFLPH
jgi:hypothetical protein